MAVHVAVVVRPPQGAPLVVAVKSPAAAVLEEKEPLTVRSALVPLLVTWKLLPLTGNGVVKVMVEDAVTVQPPPWTRYWRDRLVTPLWPTAKEMGLA